DDHPWRRRNAVERTRKSRVDGLFHVARVAQRHGKITPLTLYGIGQAVRVSTRVLEHPGSGVGRTMNRPDLMHPRTRLHGAADSLTAQRHFIGLGDVRQKL